MMAAKMPAVSSPPSTLPVSFPTMTASTALGFEKFGGINGFPSITADVAQTPSKTHGTQTIMIKMGWAMMARRKLLADFAVSQCWNKWGNIPTLSGMNI